MIFKRKIVRKVLVCIKIVNELRQCNVLVRVFFKTKK